MAQKTIEPTEDYKYAIARIYKGNKVIGAGFIVRGSYLITCAHVVREALNDSAPAMGATIQVGFPFFSLKKKFTAELLLYVYVKEAEQPNQDIAGLRLIGAVPESVRSVLPSPGHAINARFRSYGFPEGHVTGISATGKFIDEVASGWIQIQGVTDKGVALQPGFSGAPVWNELTGKVAGMVVARFKKTDQPQSQIAFMVPAKTILSTQHELEKLSLVAILQEAEERLSAAMHRAYSFCQPPGWEEPLPVNLSQRLSSLQDMAEGDAEYPALWRFVAFLSQPQLNPEKDLRDQLQAWLQKRVPDLPSLLAFIADRLSQDQQQKVSAQSHLLIYVKEESTVSRSVSALFIADASQYQSDTGMGAEPVLAPGSDRFNEKVSVEQLPALVQACWQEVGHRVAQSCVIHLILPAEWTNQDCDRWSAPNASAALSFVPALPLGADVPIVVRIAERLIPQLPRQYVLKWEEKWQALQNLSPHEVCSAFLLGDGLSIQQELAANLNQPQNLGLKRSEVCEQSQHVDLCGALLAAGTPAALWLRNDQFADGLIPADELDNLLNCNIATLPEVVRQARNAAMARAPDAHIGHHLSFLWEDPKLIPPTNPLGMS